MCTLFAAGTLHHLQSMFLEAAAHAELSNRRWNVSEDYVVGVGLQQAFLATFVETLPL